MRHAYFDGAPGIMVSGLVWIAAALACHRLGVSQGVCTPLLGGAFIYPVGAIVTIAMGRPACTSASNALNQLSMASTIWLIVGCAMAYGLFLLRPVLFFPAMVATIGSRYLIFASMYGLSIFWTMGATLIATGTLAVYSTIPPVVAAGLGGLIEVLFACYGFLKASKISV